MHVSASVKDTRYTKACQKSEGKEQSYHQTQYDKYLYESDKEFKITMVDMLKVLMNNI